jgi:acetolactate synthase I/II/III large subunit
MAGVSGVLAEAPGLAFSTKGPGLASATNGLASAYLDRMPALLVAETFPPGELDYVSHQAFDQAALVAPLMPDGEGDILDANVHSVESWLARGPRPCRRPAVMFPTGTELRAPADRVETQPDPAHIAPGDSELARTLEMLSNSRHPLVIVGLEAARPALAPQVTALVDALQAPALTTYMAAGTVSVDHPNHAGTFTGGAIEQRCVNEADLIILIGLDPVELIRKPWRYAAPVIDLCETVHQPHYIEPAQRICGPLSETLAALVDAAPVMGWPSDWNATRIAAHRQTFREGLQVHAEDGLSSGTVVQEVAIAFRGKPRLTVDAGAHMFSACAFWPAQLPRDVLISNGLATMGFAVPAAIAAALHDPARGAVAMTGDGGVLMCLGELRTAAEVGADVCIVVFNDGRLSLIDIKREERQMPDLGLGWERPDFAAIARGFGFMAWRPETPDQLEAACQEAAAASGPRLIDAQIDSSGYLLQMKSLRG